MTERHYSHAGFIPGIEGMRALAVLAVLLFHLDIPHVDGGYLGVDLFFVISGFIITRNILLDRAAGTFTLRDFYVRRFRRLFPALLVTITLTLLFAPLVMPPRELVDTAISAVYAIFSLANFNFWFEAGYFEAAAHTKPLLHTWSLSVEEQFYLFWPALLVLVSGRRPRVLLASLLLVLSFVGSLVYRDVAADAIFYLLPFRVHQLMAGALVAILSLRLAGRGGSACLVVSSVAFVLLASVLGEDISPSTGAAAATLIGFFMLLGMDSRAALAIFGSAPMQWMGKRSYAIYLVHWPLVVLFKFHTGFYLARREQLALFVFTLLGAILLHELVEKPFRKRGMDTTRAQRAALPGAVAGTCLLLGLSAFIVQQDGFSHRGDWMVRKIVDTSSMVMNLRNQHIRYGVCNLHSEHDFSDYNYDLCARVLPGKTNVLVMGDSMGADIYMMLSQAYPNLHFLQATAGACMPVINLHELRTLYPACMQLNKVRFSGMLDQDIALVVLAGKWWLNWVPAAEETVRYLRERGIPVLLFGPRSAYRARVTTLLASETTIDGVNERLAQHVQRYDTVLSSMREAMPEVAIIDMHDIQCVPACMAVDEGRLVYFDEYHFTPHGAKVMGERSRRIIDLERFIENLPR